MPSATMQPARPSGARPASTPRRQATSNPAVAALSDGGYVVTWSRSARTAPAGHLCPALRCSRQCRWERDPRQHHDGKRPVVSCRGRALGRRLRRDLDVGRPGSAHGWGIYAQRYDAAGNAVGSETRVNTTTADRPGTSCRGRALGRRLRRDLDSQRQDGSGLDIYSRTFTEDLAPELAHAISDQSLPEDQAWSFQVPTNAFADVDGDTLTYSAS